MSAQNAEVVEMPARGAVAFAEKVLFDGRKRHQWACVVKRPGQDGEYYACKSEKSARWLVGIMQKKLADERAIDAKMMQEPFKSVLDLLATIPPEWREALVKYSLSRERKPDAVG